MDWGGFVSMERYRLLSFYISFSCIVPLPQLVFNVAVSFEYMHLRNKGMALVSRALSNDVYF